MEQEQKAATTSPRVSICCSVLNQSEWLKEMVASVVAQTYKDWELIVVDDGSTEDVKGVVESFADERIRYHRFPENKGIPHGANWALHNMRGEFFGLLAADETLDPHKLEDQLAYMDETPAVDGIWGIPGRGPFGPRPLWEQYAYRAHNRSNEAWLRTLLNLEGVPIGGASFLMRRSVLDSIGYLDENLTIFSDHEFYCRFFQKHVGRILPYRWAVDREMVIGSGSVREVNKDKTLGELEYVRKKHPLPLPSVTGKSTIGIPVYNMKGFVLDALKSAQAQTYKDLEIIVLDDGSTDGTMDAVKAYLTESPDERVRLMQFDENRGLQEAMNQMAYRAEGTFFTSLAADDIIEPTFIERCRAEFDKNPWLEMVGTQTDFMDATGKNLTGTDAKHPFLNIIKPFNRTREDWLAALYPGNHYFGVSMYRTKVISEVGGWEKRFGVLADYEMYLRLLMRENIQIIEESLTHTRIHGKNISLINPEEHKKLPQLYHDIRALYFQPRRKVVISTPFYELKGFSPYIMALQKTIHLLEHVGIAWDFHDLSGDSYVHKARNIMCDRFLADPDATDLFFIDSDMSWNAEALLKMVLLPEPVVGGSYAVKNRWGSWTSRPQSVEKDGEIHLVGRALPDGTGLIKADVLAGGFLRIKREVLERFKEHYPDLWFNAPAADVGQDGEQIVMKKYHEYFSAQTDENHMFTGEDHYFSKRLKGMGVPMYIFPDVSITHWGYKGYEGNYHDFLKKQTVDQAADAMAKKFPGLDVRINPVGRAM